MTTTIRTMTAAALAAVSLSACTVLGPEHEWERRPGSVHVTVEGEAISVPQTARAGEAFLVRVLTEGGGCERQGDTDLTVNQTERRAAIRPYDYTDIAAEICTLELKTFNHDVTLSFATPGPATVEVHSHSDNPTVAPVVFRRTIQITE